MMETTVELLGLEAGKWLHECGTGKGQERQQALEESGNIANGQRMQ